MPCRYGNREKSFRLLAERPLSFFRGSNFLFPELVYGIIIAHSLSPILFEEWASATNVANNATSECILQIISCYVRRVGIILDSSKLDPRVKNWHC